MDCNICGSAVDRRENLRWKKDGYDILKCPVCGVLFRADLPTAEELSAIYGPAYFADQTGELGGQGYGDYVGEERNHRANAVARLGLLAQQGSPGRLLDVGCAAGFFLDEARRAGWTVRGVELAPTMADYARRELGLEVQVAPFADVEAEPATFDAITMWDYIEHSTDPGADLRLAADLLKPGGVLALSTGDASSVAAAISGRRWHLLTPRHHNFFFTGASLERAVTNVGMAVVDMKHRSSLYSVQYLAHKLRTMADLRLVRRAEAAVGRIGGIALPVNLFDILTVVAKRRS